MGVELRDGDDGPSQRVERDEVAVALDDSLRKRYDLILQRRGGRAVVVAADAAATVRVLSRLGPRMPGLAQELLMLAEEARTRRAQPPEDPDTGISAWRWGLIGAGLGALAAYLLG